MVSIRDYSTTAASNVSLFPEGMSPGTVNNSAREVQAELAKLQADFAGTLTTAGTSTAYTLTLTTAPAALTDGLRFSITAHLANAVGPVTLVVTPAGGVAFASKKIRSFATGGDANLKASEMVADGHYDLQYDSAADGGTGAFILLNPQAVRIQALGTSGAVQLAGGLVLQWGQVGFSAASSAPVSFPTAFTALYSLSFTINANVNEWIATPGTTGFTAHLETALTITGYWIAIGTI